MTVAYFQLPMRQLWHMVANLRDSYIQPKCFKETSVPLFYEGKIDTISIQAQYKNFSK